MNRTDKLRLLRKLTMLVVLLAGLAIASSNLAGPAAAAPCCSDCEAADQYCYTLPPAEQQQCLQDNFRWCWRWCSFSC
jgi:hypothetical protein